MENRCSEKKGAKKSPAPRNTLAHPEKDLLEEARRAVRIDIEPLPAVFTIEESLARKEIIWGGDNIFKSFFVDKGNVDTYGAYAWAIYAAEVSVDMRTAEAHVDDSVAAQEVGKGLCSS